MFMLHRILSVSLALFVPALAAASDVEIFPNPLRAERSADFHVTAGGRDVFVETFKDVAIAHFSFLGEISVSVRATRSIRKVDISPHAARIVATQTNDTLTFQLTQPRHVVVEIDGRRLFIFADPIDAAAPKLGQKGVRSVLDFGVDRTGGELDTARLQQAIDEVAAVRGTLLVPPGVYLTGTLSLKSNLTLHLAAGALLLGSPNRDDYPVASGFQESDKKNDPANHTNQGEGFSNSQLLAIENATNVRLAGHGVIDGRGSIVRDQGKPANLLRIRNSSHVTVEGVTLRNSAAWNTHILYSTHVTFRGVKVVNDRAVSNSDGIDPDSAQDVLIENCFLYAGDDAFAIKTTNNSRLLRNAERITVRGCVILTKKSALKLGTETQAEAQRDIAFTDNDIVEADRAMSLYCSDGARFERIRFERNRVERFFPDRKQRAIEFWVRHRNGMQAGSIRDVLIADTTIEVDFPNPSLIEGFNADHGVSGVRFVNYRVAGRVCRTAADARIEMNKFVQPPTFSVTP